ncbi:MAG: 30S ribosomal protein S19e [Candidatus Micrarchaeota archaeon]
MVSAYDVDALKLIQAVAKKLEEMGIKSPEWVGNVKSGAHCSRLPQDEKFWYMRCASILRQAYTHPGLGVSKLRSHYGGRKIRGVRPERHVKSGGNMIRKAMQSLEGAGLMRKAKTGREITAQGQKLLDLAAKSLKPAKE